MMTLDEVFARSNDAVFATDSTRRIVYHNDIFSRIFPGVRAGYKCHDVVCGRTLAGDNFCHAGCFVNASLMDGERISDFGLLVQPDDSPGLRVHVGAFPLPRARHGARAVFMLRPQFHESRLRVFGGEDAAASQPWPEGSLTPREREILALLAGGCSTKSLAQSLQISPATARRHIQGVFRKLGVHSRAAAVACAFRLKFVGILR